MPSKCTCRGGHLKTGSQIRNYEGPDILLIDGVQSFLDKQREVGNGDLRYPFGKALKQPHVLYDYPARMVSPFQGDLLDVAVASGAASCVGDPFMGSGTILYEAMSRGLDFVGQDINPLSALICSLYTNNLEDEALGNCFKKLQKDILGTQSSGAVIDVEHIDKWFQSNVQKDLMDIRTCIQAIDSEEHRRFFWVCLAETARQVSNSRTTTYKLHSRTDENIASRVVKAKVVFVETVQENLQKTKEIADGLREAGYLKNGRYTGQIHVSLGDIKDGFHTKGAAPDLLMSSPPYGDNRTTIPYGQHSYFPLHWVDVQDIPGTVEKELLANAYRLDSESLGGRFNVSLEEEQQLRGASPSLAATLDKLKTKPRDRVRRVLGFTSDMKMALDEIEAVMSAKAYGFWTLGNRCVGGVRIPFDDIMVEMSNQEEQLRFHRTIPRKRMAGRNASAETMLQETILLTQFT